MREKKFFDSSIDWFEHIPSRIKSVFLEQLTYQGCFAEVHAPDERSQKKYFAGIWGWNTWCGIHDMTPLADPEVRQVIKNTLQVGFNSIEPETGLFPHAVMIGPDGVMGSKIEYKTYSGEHGEAYNLDNIICWMKMILEFVLYTRDMQWFTPQKLAAIENCIAYILKNFRLNFNPVLLEAGIEGDWTENTNWEADNAIVNANMYDCLQLLAGVQGIMGSVEKVGKYLELADEILIAYNFLTSKGGFWDDKRGYYVHGNDGIGQQIYGDDYFDTSANIFPMLWGIADKHRAEEVWKFIDAHPQIEAPYPVLTNLLPRTSPRRPDYGHAVCNGDIWFCVGAMAGVARLKYGYAEKAARIFKTILDYEMKEGTLHNNIYPDGSVNAAWSPEVANYGSLFTILVQGFLGMHPTSEGLLISPSRIGGVNYFRTLQPLYYASKPFNLEIRFDGPALKRVKVKGIPRPSQDVRDESTFVLRPYFQPNTTFSIEFS